MNLSISSFNPRPRSYVPPIAEQPQSKREKALANLRCIPSAFFPSGLMNLSEIVKHYLRINPLLSMGEPNGLRGQTIAAYHRTRFLTELSNVQALVEGKRPDLVRLDYSTLLLQQHLISTCSDLDFLHSWTTEDPLDPFLQHLVLGLIENGAERITPIHLKDRLFAECKSLKEAVDDSWKNEQIRQAKIYQIAEQLFQKKESELTTPLVISDYVKSLLQRSFLEHPERPLAELSTLANQSLSLLFTCVAHSFLFQDQSDYLLQRIEEISMQNDLFWRGLQLTRPPQPKDKFFTIDSLPFRCLRRFFEQHLLPHPLLHYDRILDGWKQELSQNHPSYQEQTSILDLWGPRYLKFLWYNHARISSSSPLKAFPTVQLFLEWHGAKELRSSPQLTREELETKLAKEARQRIPEYPINSTDLELASFRLMIKK